MKNCEFKPSPIILTASSMKQLSMIGKVNQPFKAFQVAFKKSLSSEVSSSFRECCENSGSRLVYINREYDGTERYFLLVPSGFSIDFFPQDKNIIVLL